jgi:hypothetical protein
MNATKPAVKREADIEALIIATVRHFGRLVTSTELWSRIDSTFDVSFEVRRNIIEDMLDRGILIRQEVRDPRMPESYQRFYRLGIVAPEGAAHAKPNHQ